MPTLSPPDRRFQASFLHHLDELDATGEQERYAGLDVISPTGGFAGERYTPEQLRDPAHFAEFCHRLRALADPASWLPDGIVHATMLWWVDDTEYLGRLSIRHELTPWLLEYGGHIGYAVRPSARRQGHATAMLAAALPVAARLGIDPVLVTCDDTNEASRLVIERNGGVLEDQRGEKLRYWIATTPPEPVVS